MLWHPSSALCICHKRVRTTGTATELICNAAEVYTWTTVKPISSAAVGDRIQTQHGCGGISGLLFVAAYFLNFKLFF